jgi:hypothetical protein
MASNYKVAVVGFAFVRADGTTPHPADPISTLTRQLRVQVDPTNSNTSDGPKLQVYIQRELDSSRELVICNETVCVTGNGEYSDAAPPPGVVTLITSGVAQPLSETSVPIRGLLAQAPVSNANNVYLGIGTAISGRGVCLKPGDPPVPIPASDLNLIFAVAVAGGDTLLYLPRG